MPDGTLVNKDIGYEELTEEELLFLYQSTESDLISYALIYNKLKKWKEYVKKEVLLYAMKNQIIL